MENVATRAMHAGDVRLRAFAITDDALSPFAVTS
jgi:hypothetical protein